VTGTGPLGCVPSELAQRGRNGECAAELQQAAELFNPQLEQMLLQLNRKLGKDVFIAANTGKMHNNFVSNPQQFGTNYFSCPLCQGFTLWLQLCNRNLHCVSCYLKDNVVAIITFKTMLVQ